MEENIFEQRIDLSELNRTMEGIRSEIARIIVGQQNMIDLLMIGLLCDGHRGPFQCVRWREFYRH